jgi:hypothetical protein
MPQNGIACDRDQELLPPPNLKEWLPEDHLAWFVLATAKEMDLSAGDHAGGPRSPSRSLSAPNTPGL